MNDLIEFLYTEHGPEANFVVNDWYAKHLQQFEVYESKGYLGELISREYVREKTVWMQKINECAQC